jgi:selenocysteine-specific elongation factor
VRAGADLWFDRAAVDALRERVRAHLAEHGRLETPAYKTLIGTSRRTAVPLMELFDEEHVTLRRGDVRLPRGRPAGDR